MIVVDLFAGAGGFGLGFRLAGYDLCCSLEVDTWAADTLEHNKQNGSVILRRDIRELQTREDIRRACGDIRPDVVIGGPPCQGFSVAGPANKDPKDPRNSLFKDFARWVEYLKPPFFVMENVKGLLRGQNANKEKTIDIIKKTFTDLDYGVEVWILNAAHFGVPQLRERVFVVGNRLGKKIGYPTPNHRLGGFDGASTQLSWQPSKDLPDAITVWDAISDLPSLAAGEGQEEQPYDRDPKTGYQRWARGSEDVLHNHVAMKHRRRMIERFELIERGESIVDVPEEHRARKRNGNGEISQTVYDMNNRRLDPDSPSFTIPAHFYSSFVHPYEHRNITAREAARLQSFPDWYHFQGKRTVISRKLLERLGRYDENHLSQYNQIGNAVPPLLAKHIAEHIKSALLTDIEALPSNT